MLHLLGGWLKWTWKRVPAFPVKSGTFFSVMVGLDEKAWRAKLLRRSRDIALLDLVLEKRVGDVDCG
jgi:hypothetical protein